MPVRHLTLSCVLGALVGCAAERRVDVQSLRGPLDEVVKVNHLDQYHSWPMMGLSADDDPGTTYILERGDLVLRYHGDPPTVTSAEFWPSGRSAEERFQQANAGWEEYVKAHTGSKPAK
jgi:hypothetical protein